MVHNGIEYAIMALISEAYELMKNGINLSDKEIGAVFNDWNKGRLQSYLLEITATIFKHTEPGDQDILINYIKDEAKSKSTGKWTSQEAMDLQAVATAIDTAVAMRDLSKQKDLRVKAAELYGKSIPIETDQKQFLVDLEQAMYFSMMITYAQGMEMLQKASIELNYKLNLSDCAKIWRGGCIIRAEFLEEIYQAFKKEENLPNLLADKKVVEEIKKTITGARNTAVLAINASLAIPVFTATLSYFDSLKTGRMPSNLIQAQRDYFGAHTYERIDKEGTFHTKWD
jgi:6-phosphogluconate dehydrogenase